ncbi:MAG: 16S rRNA (uracil(1498)-N(3))-methyltransferase, partial [Clostridiales bacterium]|nr:16S rRNA (uracil(1498)-N(3))-methyltransferase [Clostridiales bacterium]
MERFYVDPDRIRGKEARIRGEEYRHLHQVLRLKIGDTLEVFDGKGRGFSGRLAEFDKQQAVVSLEAPVTEQRDSALRVCLAQAVPKGDRMEWVVQKATELGVAAIQPLELSRCIVRLESDVKRRDRQARW